MFTQSFQFSTKKYRYVLLAVLATLLSVYMSLVWYFGDTAHLGMSGLFILALGLLLWERSPKYQLTPSRTGLIVGGLGVVVSLGVSAFLLHQRGALRGDLITTPLLVALLRLLPALATVSVAILASGMKGVRQFWREEVLLLALGLPGAIAPFIADISPLTAMFSAALLQVGGFEVVREGLRIGLPGGGVIVYYGCSGMESVCYLLSMSVLFLVLFPVSGLRKYLAPLAGMFFGFVINGFRVALMAILWAERDVERFDYWHEGDGSLIFGLAAVAVFSGFYMLILKRLEQRRSAVLP